MPKDAKPNITVSVSVTETEEFKQLCELLQDMSRTLSFYADGGRDKGEKARSQLEVHDKIINDLIDKDIVPVNHTPPARGDNTYQI